MTGKPKACVERQGDGHIAVWFEEADGALKGFTRLQEPQFLQLLEAISLFVITEIRTPTAEIQQVVA